MYLQAQEKASRGYIGVAKCICEGSKKQREDAAAGSSLFFTVLGGEANC